MVLAATVVCGACLFTSCKKDKEAPDLNVAEKIIGKWMTADVNGQPAKTNDKMVITFVSTTKAYISASFNAHQGAEIWGSQMEVAVAIDGNKVTLTNHTDEHTTSVEEYTVTAISDNDFTANQKVTVTVDGTVAHTREGIMRYVKVPADYSEAILGLWECKEMTGDETYNDANGRLEFLSDGTYRYYRMNDNGQWKLVTNREFQDYFVDGTLLATRWKNEGEDELREWWEIYTLGEGWMVWTALRQKEDGTTFQQNVIWEKIDLNVAEKIIGKWMFADKNGNPMPTNEKMVITFVSATKAKISASLNAHPEAGTPWDEEIEADVNISGNKVNVSFHRNERHTAVHEYIITSINGSEFTANHKVTSTVDGEVVFFREDVVRYVKQTADYSEAILGLWECTGLTGIETYNDANARLEFLSDGTYRYYRKDDAGQWQAVTTRDFQDYFVDGTLLATRWKNQGEDELREWWEIESLSGNEMVWTALRQNADGTTVQQKMTWKKIDLKVSEKIIGKWMTADIDGQPALTNMESVYTFVSTTRAYMSASFNHVQATGTPWHHNTEADVAISGNKVTLTFHADEHNTSVQEFTVTAIDGTEFTANQKVTVTVDGNVVHSDEHTFRLIKQTTDYTAAIVGTWQGHCTSEGSVFDDGQEHRWEYKADGTYVYYVKDGDSWVPYEGNTLNEYFVDGTLLCTRWIDQGKENREWWEITIAGNKMNWTALRQNPDGTTFTATFEMSKVN